ncbi:MAG TPA: serine protease [Armatimonadota bacterium]|nr:serine protease [Armatimonadota bacterium]
MPLSNPGLGALPVRRVSDYPDRVPAAWRAGRAGDLFLPLYPHEALFLVFMGAAWKPSAVKVGVGGVNAVSGAAWDELLRDDPQDYLVCPPQPWLDGINAGQGVVRQFVAVPLGEGYSVEAQVTGEETVGGIQIVVWDPKPGYFPVAPPPEPEGGDGALDESGLEGVAYAEAPAMGIGAGGRMQQRIYPDPHGVDVWESAPVASLRVHLVPAADWEALTGEEPPPNPISAQHYTALGLPWFALDDAGLGGIGASATLAGVKSVRQLQREKEATASAEAEEASLDVPEEQVVRLGLSDQPEQNEGRRSKPGKRREDTMKNPQMTAARRRLLPQLEAVRDRLRTVEPGELLAQSGLVRTGGSGEEGLESFVPGEAEPPQKGLLETALDAQLETTVHAGARALEKLANHGDDADLTPDEQTGFEAIILLTGRPAILIQGGDFFPPPPEWSVLNTHGDALRTTFRSVGRIEVEGHPELDWVGTGFLVGPDIIMTNRHVAAEFTGPRGNGRWGIRPGMRARIDFAEEFGGGATAEFEIRSLIGIHGRFDMALFRVATKGGPDGKMELPPPLPIAARPEQSVPLPNRNVYVVGYPAWDGRRNDPEPMQRLFANIYNVKRLQPGTLIAHQPDQKLFTHDCSTLGGNSGSCVLDLDSHKVLGLHFGGRFRKENQAVALWDLANDPLIRHAGIHIS